jgi:hypothetical protein
MQHLEVPVLIMEVPVLIMVVPVIVSPRQRRHRRGRRGPARSRSAVEGSADIDHSRLDVC